MPTGIYKRIKPVSEQTRKKMSKSHKGKKVSSETIKKMCVAQKGRFISDEHRNKISKSRVGKHYPLLSKALKGKLAWNKNTALFGTKICKCCHKEFKGRIISQKRWFLRKYCSLKCLGIAQKNKIITKETRKKMSIAKILNPNKVYENTKIELKIEEELKRRHIDYKKQVSLCNIAIVDFYLPNQKIIIQCDGCYWHSCAIHYPNGKGNYQKERTQDTILESNDFKVYRFWEHDINKSAEECINRINR